MPRPCELRQSKYLNNLVEQDHRFIKRLVKLGMGFFSSEAAWQTLQGYEAMNMLRKGPDAWCGQRRYPDPESGDVYRKLV